jgi:RNA ligase
MNDIHQKIQEFNIPVVAAIPAFQSIQQLIEYTRPLENEEGFVITFNDGHRVKIKAEQYVTIHKTLDKIRHDRHIVLLILDQNLDDVISLLPQEEQDRIRKFEKTFWDTITKASLIFSDLYQQALNECGKNPKCVALEFIPKLNTNNNIPTKLISTFMFGQLNGKTVMELFLPIIKNACSSNKKFDDFMINIQQLTQQLTQI